MTEQTELAIRVPAFLLLLVGLSTWELIQPRRRLTVHQGKRWANNLGLLVLNTVGVRSLLPLTAAATAALALEHGWGVLNHVDWPDWFEVIVTVMIMDLAIYLQHVLFHAVPVLWRLHLVHHADLDCDVTTGVRFHPLEMLLSALIKIGVVAALGPSVVGVVLFETLLNTTSMFNHSNIRLPIKVDQWLRWFVVTPDMHRVHHSTQRHEAGSNFGFNMPWWDYVLGTYLPQPEAGHDAMSMGVVGLQEERMVERLPGMLSLPFQSAASDHR